MNFALLAILILLLQAATTGFNYLCCSVLGRIDPRFQKGIAKCLLVWGGVITCIPVFLATIAALYADALSRVIR